MLKNTMLFFASSVLAITGAFANDVEEKLASADLQIEIVEENTLSVEDQAKESSDATLSCDEATEKTESNLSCESAENANEANLGFDKDVVIEPEDGILSCNSCKDILSCSCHGKGKTKELAVEANVEQAKNEALACGCLTENESEV